MDELTFNPETADAVRVQVQFKGEWMTVLQVPHKGYDSETGKKIVYPFWPQVIKGLDLTLKSAGPLLYCPTAPSKKVG